MNCALRVLREESSSRRRKSTRAAPGSRRQQSDRRLVCIDDASPGFDAQQWLALPGQLAQGRPGWLAEATPSQAIAVLQQICHDAMALAAGAAPRYFSRAALAALRNWSREQGSSLYAV